MIRNRLLFLTLLALASVSWTFADEEGASIGSAQTKPNVILILADDMGIDSVSALNPKMGMQTPSIDQLVREGMAFTDAHSTSGVCSPTRYSVLTGRYHWRSRLKRGIVGKWERPLFKDARLTLAEMFQEAGYATACIGKWHLGWHWPKQGGGTTEKLAEIDFTAPVKGGPNDHGFDYYYGDDVPNWPPFVWRENEKILGKLTAQMRAGTMVGVNDGPSVPSWDFHAVLAEYSKRWAQHIRDAARSDKPFFLFAPMPSPHTPIAPSEAFQGRSEVSAYADFLMETDAAVGAMMKALENSGQTNETVVIFTCDNGTSPKADFAQLKASGIDLNANWRGWKADVYEGGHRVPFLVRWPGKIQAGSRSDQTITLADIMATCASIIDFKLPDTAAEDSVSLLPVLTGTDVNKRLHEAVVHQSGSGHFAIRRGPWKLLFCRGSGGWSPPRENEAAQQELPSIQLYNLESDPKESNNLHAEHPQIVSELTAKLRQIIERGRSTPGAEQPNHGDADWWKGLPWPKP